MRVAVANLTEELLEMQRSPQSSNRHPRDLCHEALENSWTSRMGSLCLGTAPGSCLQNQNRPQELPPFCLCPPQLIYMVTVWVVSHQLHFNYHEQLNSTLVAIQNIIVDCIIHKIPLYDTYFVCLSLVKQRLLFTINRKPWMNMRSLSHCCQAWRVRKWITFHQLLIEKK